MAETKYKFDYTKPENVECEVPGEQKYRESESDTGNENTVWDENKIDPATDYILAPVVTVTRKEATFTKGDMKLQKVSVTEDVSEIKNGIFHTIKDPAYPLIHSDVIHDNPIRIMDASHSQGNGPQPIRRRVSIEAQKSQTEERRTRIPTRFQNAVQRVRREKSVPAKKVNETVPPHPRRSSIPRLKSKTQSPKPEDEFERLYGEIADSPTDIDISLLNNKVEDPEKVENIFEEIIHAYDENQIQTTVIESPKIHDENKIQHVTNEKPKQSKIPMLKRKSEAEIDVPKSVQANSKVSSPSVEKSRFKDVVSKVSKAETSGPKLIAGNTVTKRGNVDNNVQLKTSYQRVKSMSRDKQKYDLQVENIVQNSTEQDIGPDNVAHTVVNETLESTIEIIEMTPSIENIDLATQITVQPYTVEIIASPTSLIVEEVQNGFIEIKEVSENEPTTGNEADIALTEIKTPIDPVKVVSVDEFKNIITKEFDKFEPVLDVNRNVTTAQVNNNIGYFARDEISVEKENLSTTATNVDKNILGNDTEHKQPQFPRTTNPDSQKETASEDDDVIVRHKSVLSKIAMFEQQRREDRANPKSIPKPAARCSYRRKLAKEVLEPKETTAKPNNEDLVIDDDDLTKPELPKSKVPEPEWRTTFVDSTPVIVSEVIKPTESNLIIDETYNPVEIETINHEVNNVLNSESLRKPRMEIKTEEIVVSNAIEQEILENQTVTNEIEERAITISNTGNERIKRHHPNRYSFEVDYSHEKTEKVEKANELEIKSLTSVEIEYAEPVLYDKPIRKDDVKPQDAIVNNKTLEKQEFKYARRDPKESPFDFTPKSRDYKSTNHKISPTMSTDEILSVYRAKNDDYNLRKAKSVAELDLGDAVKGKVKNLIVRMKSVDRIVEKKEFISAKERPRKKSVMEKITLFESAFGHVTANYAHNYSLRQLQRQPAPAQPTRSEDEYRALIDELKTSKQRYGQATSMPKMTLNNGEEMPVMAVGTALLDPRLASTIVATAIDLGYRAIDTAFIYGTEKAVGEGIKQKIDDGTVKRKDLFVIAKLWSTYHRMDLVESAYKQTLENLGLDYVDLYLIHNPMSFKEGSDPVPMIAKVVQYSEHDFMDAWYGMENLVTKGLVKSIGLSNFNSSQVQKVMEKARYKPVINQVECHPYLSQDRMDNFCDERNIKLSCFGVLGSKGTPAELKNTSDSAIDDPMVQVMAAGMNISPAQLLIRFQIQSGRAVVVKASTGAHMWDNLQALSVQLDEAQMNALRAMNRNKRAFAYKGMGDTHKNYPFNAPF